MPKRPFRNSSAKRNNQRNDVADTTLVNRIMRRQNKAVELEAAADKLSRKSIADQVKDGFALQGASPATWQKLVEHQFWSDHPKQRPTLDDQADAIKYVLRIHYGDHPNASKRSSDYWLAVQQLQTEKLANEEIIKKIRSGESIATILKRKRDPKPVITKKPGKTPPAKHTTPKKAVAASTVDGHNIEIHLEEEFAKKWRSAIWPAKVKLQVQIDADGKATASFKSINALE